MFNIQNSGWNLHAGITGGEYVASTSGSGFVESSPGSGFNAGWSSFNVPFLGVYAAATGHGFFADAVYRHDFWQGEVLNQNAGLTNAALNGGNGNAVTVEGGYNYRFENGMMNGILNGITVTPSIGFNYTRVTFDPLTLFPTVPTTSPAFLNVGAVDSDLGRLGVAVSDTFVTPYFALIPNVTASVWHEFAGPVSSDVAVPNQFFSQSVSDTRVGTFGQFSLGVTAQPLENPRWTMFVRADYRTGGNIYGATLTGGVRYQF
jgi:outer membrane autotransporter protein